MHVIMLEIPVQRAFSHLCSYLFI